VKREVGRQKLEKKGQSAEGAMHSIDFCEEEKIKRFKEIRKIEETKRKCYHQKN